MHVGVGSTCTVLRLRVSIIVAVYVQSGLWHHGGKAQFVHVPSLPSCIVDFAMALYALVTQHCTRLRAGMAPVLLPPTLRVLFL